LPKLWQQPVSACNVPPHKEAGNANTQKNRRVPRAILHAV
jgi:hypothetical protein